MALDVVLVRLLIIAAVASVLPARGRADGAAGLAIGFYNEKCPGAEDLVLEEMRDIVHEDRTLGPALLRLLFHDCFVRVRVGCVACGVFPCRVACTSRVVGEAY